MVPKKHRIAVVVGVLLVLAVAEMVFEEMKLLILEAPELYSRARKLEAQLEARLEVEGVPLAEIHLAHSEVEK